MTTVAVLLCLASGVGCGMCAFASRRLRPRWPWIVATAIIAGCTMVAGEILVADHGADPRSLVAFLAPVLLSVFADPVARRGGRMPASDARSTKGNHA
jgi:hypothetical protein